MMWAPGVRLALGVVAVALTVGCGGRALAPDGGGGGLGGTGTAGTGGDGTPFVPTRNVDILFVIKNAGSTRLTEVNLLNNFPTFMTALATSPGGLPNLHVAVMTPDLGAGDGSIGGCPTGGGDGARFQYAARGTCPSTGLNAGATFIEYDQGFQNYAGQLADVFTCIAAVGDNGCAFGQPLRAITRALGADGAPPPTENEGFLRPDAFLLVVVVSDEDDCSVPAGSGLFDTQSGTTLDSPLGPLGHFRCNEFGVLCDGVKPPRRAPNGSVNDTVTLDGCVSAEGAGMLTPLATIASQLRSLKAHPDQQILFATITAPSTPYTVYWRQPSTPDPAGPWPDTAHSCIATDGSFGDPAVRINQFATSFGANGKVFSLCDQSFAPLLQTLGNMIAQRIPEPASMP